MTKKIAKKVTKKSSKASPKKTSPKVKALDQLSKELEALMVKHEVETYMFGGVIGNTGITLGQGDTNDLIRLNSLALAQLTESK